MNSVYIDEQDSCLISREHRHGKVTLLLAYFFQIIVFSALIALFFGFAQVRANSPVFLKDINTLEGNSFSKDFHRNDNLLYIVANDRIAGAELWRTDGTEPGTTHRDKSIALNLCVYKSNDGYFKAS